MSECELVLAGVLALLGGERSRIQVVAVASPVENLDDVDVVLFDMFGPEGTKLGRLEELAQSGGVPVIAYCQPFGPDWAQRAIECGAAGCVSAALTGREIAEAVEVVAQGGVVSPQVDATAPRFGEDAPDCGAAGLSPREAEILTLIAHGLTNNEIAACTWVSLNTVKTVIRSAYRKIGVHTRSQAILWAIENRLATIPGPTQHPPDA